MSDHCPEIAERLADVRGRIAAAAARAGRAAAAVRLVAVSKKKPAEAVRAAAAAGQLDFGENYVQELLGKQEALADLVPAVRWHAIGPLQRNKVRQVVGRVDLLHAVDSARLLDEIDRRSADAGVVTPVLLQVNIALEDSKSGCDEAALPALVHHALGLRGAALRGLMTMPPFFADPEAARPFFARLRTLRDALVAEQGVPAEALRELSMGMSGDYEVAVEEGATLVRVGAAIFGERS